MKSELLFIQGGLRGEGKIFYYFPQLLAVQHSMELAQQFRECQTDLFLQQDMDLWTETDTKKIAMAKNKIRILTFFIFQA